MTDAPEVKVWICTSDDTVIVGTPDQASAHFDESDCYHHWLYEFELGLPPKPTGREIHTADRGGYYLSLPQDMHSYVAVIEAFALKKITPAIHQATLAAVASA